MKINIIPNKNYPVSYIDLEVLDLMFKKRKTKIEPQMLNNIHYKCENASINIFVHCINYNYFQFAKVNILIINHEYLNKSWIDYLPCFDYVIVKSEYSKCVVETAMKKSGYSTSNLVCIPWRSPNIETFTKNKEFKTFLLYCNNRKSEVYKRVVDLWKPEWPTLRIINAENSIFLANPAKRRIMDNIDYCDGIKNDEFHPLFNSCGIHLCLNEITSFSHFISQAKQVHSIPVAVNGGANKEQINREFAFLLGGKKKKSENEHTYGSRFVFKEDELIETIEKIISMKETTLELMSRDGYTDYLKGHRRCEALFNDLFDRVIKTVRTTKRRINKTYKEEELPHVSIITPTYNRKKMFQLAIYNFNTSTYPKNKLEWIIVDDSDELETIEGLLPPKDKREQMGINYIRLDERKTIGEKRNIATENAKNNIIVCMDDDDYYYPHSITNRITNLLNSKKSLVCCTIIGMLDIHKYMSIINVPPFENTFGKCVSEATLTFYKNFWENNRFDDRNYCEADNMLNGRLNEVEVMDWEDIIVSIIHKSNISDRRAPYDAKPNGNHFGFSEKLFDFIIKLDKSDKK